MAYVTVTTRSDRRCSATSSLRKSIAADDHLRGALNAWGHVGEIELLTAHHNAADGYAERRSTEYWAASFAVTSRELEKAGSLRVLSEWRNGEKIREPKGHDGHGEWRKTRHVD